MVLTLVSIHTATACGPQSGTGLEAFAENVENIVENGRIEFTMIHSRYDTIAGTFEELSPPEGKRNLVSVHQLGESLYVLGGLNEDGNYLSTLESYDAATDSWNTRAPLPRPGLAFTAVAGNHLCTFAGFENIEQPLRREIDCYDPELDEWFEGPDLPEAYSSAFPIVHGGRIYLFGGTDAELHFFDTAWSYAPNENVWREEKSLPEGRAFMGVQSVGESIVVVGGFSAATFGPDKAEDQVTYIYDPVARAWATGPGMPNSRGLYGLDEVAGRLAVFFGVTDGPLVEFFDVATREWREGTDPPELPDGGVYTYTKHDERMYLFAVADAVASNSISSSGSLLRYDPETDEWEQVAKRSSSELDALFSSVPLNDGIHFVGAHTRFTTVPKAEPFQ